MALGGRLGVHTTAEGIEHPNQLSALKGIGCDLGQGYWFSPPLAPDAFFELLMRNLEHGGFDTTLPRGPRLRQQRLPLTGAATGVGWAARTGRDRAVACPRARSDLRLPRGAPAAARRRRPPPRPRRRRRRGARRHRAGPGARAGGHRRAPPDLRERGPAGRPSRRRACASGPGPSTCSPSASARARSWSWATSTAPRWATTSSSTWPSRSRPAPGSGSWWPSPSAAGARCAAAAHEVVEWGDVAARFDTGPEYAEVAELRGMHQSDVAERIRALPPAKRRRLAELMEDDRLADLLEELPEDEQVRLIDGLDLERAAHVLEEMEPDDAADLLGRDDRGRAPAPAGGHAAGGLHPAAPAAVLRRGHRRRADDPGAHRAARRRPPWPRPWPPSASPTGPWSWPPRCSWSSRRRPRRPVASSAACRSSGSCGNRRPPGWRTAPTTTPSRCRPTCPSATWPSAWPPTTPWPCPCATRPTAWSGAVTVDDVLDHVLPPGWRRRRRPHLTGDGT